MNDNQLKIVGCGGHSKVVIDALSALEVSFKISLCDDNQDLIGKEISGIIVDSTVDSLKNYSGFVHVAIGNNQVRQLILNTRVDNGGIRLFTIIHPAAVISKSATIGEGAFIAAKAILGPDSFIDKGCIVNHGAIVDHDVIIGACSHIAPNSTLGGKVKIGQGVLIGAGAVVLPGIIIDDGAIVAAGAVVTKNVAKNTVVKGIPAL